MVVHNFDKIFQGILNADPSCMFPLSCYFLLDWYKDYFPKCSYAQEQINSIELPARPNIDLSTLRDMIGDHLVSSLTTKGLNYWQNLCELQHARKDVEEYKINTIKFTIPYKIHDEISRLHLEIPVYYKGCNHQSI